MPVSNRPAASEQADIYSIYPSYYFPLYANTPSSSLFNPILLEKLYAESDGRWSSDQVRNYVSAFNNATGTDIDADELFDFESELDMDGEESADSRSGNKTDNSSLSDNPGRKKVLESLLSSGSYLVYNSLTGSSDMTMPEVQAMGCGGYGLLSRAYIYPRKDSADAASAGGNQQNWLSKFDEPEPEPKFDKIL